MQQQTLKRTWGARFITFLAIWLTAGAVSVIAIIAYLISNVRDTSQPIVAVAGISLVVVALVIYSLPTLLARLSEHPSKTGVAFVNWFLGWTVVAWIGAMIWALSGFNGRLRTMRSGANSASDQQALSKRFGSIERTMPTAVALCGFMLLMWGLYLRVSTGNPNGIAQSSDSANVSLPGKKVTARGLGLAPGAFVCKDLTTVGQMISMYGEAWLAQQRSRHMSQDQKLLTGDPGEVSLPNPDDYGCILVPAGGTMFAEGGQVIPIIRVALPNGDIFEGVTNPDMIVKQVEPPNSTHSPVSAATLSEPTREPNPAADSISTSQTDSDNAQTTESSATLPSSQTPVLAPSTKPRHWFTLRNGDMVLDSIHDPCATLITKREDSSGLKLVFRDGRAEDYAFDEAMKAQSIAESSCPAL